MDEFSPIAHFTVPWGRQQIELQEARFDAGGAALLRIRIREGRRFTIFDVDAATAQAWGAAMQQWAAVQLGDRAADAGKA